MEIERLARKLKPLMPRQVEHWLRVRNTAEPELKNLLERQIEAHARAKLGDYDNRILLSLPPERAARGPLHLGTVVYEKDKWPFGLRPDELMQGMSVFGRSGSGKTNLLFHLLRQLDKQGVGFIFMDWKRTGRHMLGLFKNRVKLFTPGRALAPLTFNPFIPPPGLEPVLYFGHVVDALAEAYTLGDGARLLLQRALNQLHNAEDISGGTPTVSQIIDELNRVPDKGRVSQWKVSALRALESLRFTDLASQTGTSQQQQIENLVKGATIIELNGLNESAKRFLIETLALWMFRLRLTTPVRERLDFVLVVDEAHHVLYRGHGRASAPRLEGLLRQFRELGVGVIVADQHIHLTSAAAVGNSFVTVFLDQKEPRDIAVAASICGLDGQEKSCLARLDTGQAIVRLQGRWRQPVLVRVPLLQVDKGRVSDEVLRDYLAHTKPYSAGHSGGNRLHVGGEGGFRGIPAVDHGPDGVMDQDSWRFLEDVQRFPDDGVRQRYRRLSFGGSKGRRIQELLLDGGWLEAQQVRVGHSRKLLLRLSARARSSLGLEIRKTPNESLAHAYWKRRYAQHLEQYNYEVQIEAPRHGGRVDILALRDGAAIAIEVETGHSNVVENVRNCLRSQTSHVFVVATDLNAMEIVERQLGRAGLLIPSHVTVVLADRGLHQFKG